MNIVSAVFLKAKHWQLFLFNAILPLAFFIILLISLINHIEWKDPEPRENILLFVFLITITILFHSFLKIVTFTFISLGLHRLTDKKSRFKLKHYAFSVAMKVIFGILTAILIFGVFGITGGNAPNYVAFLLPWLLLIAAVILGFSHLYYLYVVTRFYKTAEWQKRTGIGDFIGEILLMHYYNIGIWFLQPKINNMYFENKKKDNQKYEI